MKWFLAAASAAYLAYGGTVYLDLKSSLPYVLCAAGGAALAAPMLLVVRRPLLAWHVALVAAAVTGAAVQAHGRTPFSWHPAVLAAQLVLLAVLAWRRPLAVTAWAFASMAALICLSFYPADWLQLIAVVAVIMGVTLLIRAARRRSDEFRPRIRSTPT
jgi:hypothetical protein